MARPTPRWREILRKTYLHDDGEHALADAVLEIDLGSPTLKRIYLPRPKGGPTIVASRVELRRLRNTEGSIMLRIPHELRDEFSQEAELIERLRNSDHEFGRLAASYEEINKEIHRIESEEAPTTDEVLETFKKRRLMLKDEITAFLKR